MIEAPVRSARSKALAPYVGLVPFSDQDAEWFFGRERERQMITSNLVASRLTLLYGESGVGKTSVLQAGVVHHLRGRARQQMDQDGRPRFVVVEFSAWQGDPMPALLEAIRHSVKTVYQSRPDRMPALPPAALRGDRTVALDETLARWAEVVGTSFLLIMDQFEEYFLYHAQEDGPGTFADRKSNV